MTVKYGLCNAGAERFVSVQSLLSGHPESIFVKFCVGLNYISGTLTKNPGRIVKLVAVNYALLNQRRI